MMCLGFICTFEGNFYICKSKQIYLSGYLGKFCFECNADENACSSGRGGGIGEGEAQEIGESDWLLC